MIIESDIDEQINEFFTRNIRELEAGRGHALAPGVRQFALNQVKMYFARLSEIAERVTDTEVKLTLPGQTTPSGRKFTIEGIVDIIRERDKTVLYDIKTHDTSDVVANVPDYEGQLNVYAHIWQTLRGEPLDEMAIISTRYPAAIEEALIDGDEEQLRSALAAWQPVVPIPFSPERVKDMVHEFGGVVDQIEDHEFPAPPLTILNATLPGMRSRFAVAICRNCDARFSCASYREYMRSSGGPVDATFRRYLNDLGDDLDQEEFLAASLDAAMSGTDIEA